MTCWWHIKPWKVGACVAAAAFAWVSIPMGGVVAMMGFAALFGVCVFGVVLPTVWLLLLLPHLLALHIGGREISDNTLHQTAVAWCTADPKMIEVFRDFKHKYDAATPTKRACLILDMLHWQQPENLFDLDLTHEQAQEQYDALFSDVDVEVQPQTMRLWARKYLKV